MRARESVALAYLDLPFNSRMDYAVYLEFHAQITASAYTCKWAGETELALDGVAGLGEIQRFFKTAFGQY
jgi:hypothetical protein